MEYVRDEGRGDEKRTEEKTPLVKKTLQGVNLQILRRSPSR